MAAPPVGIKGSEPRREALQAIVSVLGDRLELISPTDYRALRERDGELPAPAAIWEMFGGFHRMRECALLVRSGS
jgi:hypothetical protein